MRILLLIVVVAAAVVSGCQVKPAELLYDFNEAEIIHKCQKKLTDFVVNDIFSPPVASRVYVYPSLAAYEAGRFAGSGTHSFASRLRNFEEMPQPEAGKEYNYVVASVDAFFTVAKRLVFSKEPLQVYKDSLLGSLAKSTSPEVYERSIQFGESVANTIIRHLDSDNYRQTRGMERLEVKALPGLWVPTPPDYADALEPHWPEIMTLVMDSSAQCNVALPDPYSEDKESPFWKETQEVYEIVRSLTDEQDEITTFWDDNPFVSRHKGHLMFQDKKVTPGGHWLAICRTVCRNERADFVTTLRSYALTSVALFDAFIGCWDLKYRTVRVRPETVINEKIDKQWLPHLITPPFPAYTSGHSTVSAAAAEALTSLFGEQVAFVDSTQLEYGLPVRSFRSFREAALEASISRVYGGIHFRSDCARGNEQGTKIGTLVVDRLK
jgi:hypothetical protein